MVEPEPSPEVGPSTHCHGAARPRRRWNKKKAVGRRGSVSGSDCRCGAPGGASSNNSMPCGSSRSCGSCCRRSHSPGRTARCTKCCRCRTNRSLCRCSPCWSAQTPRHPGFVLVGKLALLATLLWTDISGVEARHATIRRLLMNASANTHTLSFQDLSAYWAFLQMRNREVDAAPEGEAGQVAGCGQGEARQGPSQGEGRCVGGVPRLRLFGGVKR